MGYSNRTNLLSPANFGSWMVFDIPTGISKGSCCCLYIFAYFKANVRYTLVRHHLLSGCHGLLMDLLLKDKQKEQSGQHITTDILALHSNIKNYVDKVGPTEDDAWDFCLPASHFDYCNIEIRWRFSLMCRSLYSPSISSSKLLTQQQQQRATHFHSSTKFTLLRTYSVYVPVLLLMANLNKERAISSGSQGNDRHAYVKGGRGFVCPASRCFMTFLLDTLSTAA
ncbi:hypothetical protein ACFE04_022045 [Oxalis oulophora]